MTTKTAKAKNDAAHSHRDGIASCPMFRMLPESLQEEFKKTDSPSSTPRC